MSIGRRRQLLLLGTVFTAAAYFPRESRATEAKTATGSNLECSTCESDLFNHWFLSDCCMPGGDGCYNASGAHTSSSGGWCSDFHDGCAQT